MRSIKTSGPFCWAEKAALRRISETFGECGTEVSARSVYLALCQIASDQQSDHFRAAVATIAARSGVSRRYVHKILNELSAAGLIKIQQRSEAGLKVQSNYTILAIGNKDASMGTNVISIGTELRPHSSSHTRTISEQSSEESMNKGNSGLSFAEKARKALG